MKFTSDPRLVAEQMWLANGILNAFANGAMPMHATAYHELASWVRASFEAMASSALRAVRDAAPLELQGLAESVLHERGVISWAATDIVGLSSYAECQGLLKRLRASPRQGGGSPQS